MQVKVARSKEKKIQMTKLNTVVKNLLLNHPAPEQF